MVQFAKLYLTWFNLELCTLHGSICQIVPYMVQFIKLYLAWFNLEFCTLHGLIFKNVPYSEHFYYLCKKI